MHTKFQHHSSKTSNFRIFDLFDEVANALLGTNRAKILNLSVRIFMLVKNSHAYRISAP